jgi:hypothetical protein
LRDEDLCPDLQREQSANAVPTPRDAEIKAEVILEHDQAKGHERNGHAHSHICKV